MKKKRKYIYIYIYINLYSLLYKSQNSNFTNTYTKTYFCNLSYQSYDAPMLQLESCICIRYVSVLDSLGYFIDTYQ